MREKIYLRLKIMAYIAPELKMLHKVVSSLFRGASAERILELSLENTESLQELIDFLEQQSSKLVSSYEAIYDEPPDLTSLTHLAPTTTHAI
jgi:hypothetical protein